MSNLQDVPLAEPEQMAEDVAATGAETAEHKSNSLKRFFKMGKKSSNLSEANDEVSAEVEEDINKEQTKHNSISRFLTRLKNNPNKTSETADNHTSSNMAVQTEQSEIGGEKPEKPAPNAKHNLRTSISGYWKMLFHRQKNANQQDANNEQSEQPSDVAAEAPAVPNAPPVPEQQQQQAQQTETVLVHDVSTETPSPSHHDLMQAVLVEKLPQVAAEMPNMLEAVQMLAVSDDVAVPMHDDN
ncbi:immunoglobulin A1 protease autotransporter isoform X2 [Drosophila busckii]|uniref:immunoglobulin A1 protease autotransporter isoform X2 n=1 Tax=Drosophila busckii TaxID=30019 RepID=UPI00083F232E|nr:immunoglobulin A1 protease autotransporter isoform X2 [Drosophila busckii]